MSLSEFDAHLISEGNHLRLYEHLGAHPEVREGVAGVSFAVWAPNASAASVVGDFNAWQEHCDPLAARWDCGIWEGFVPAVEAGARYKFALRAGDGSPLPYKADPFAFRAELRPATASIVTADSTYAWNDDDWMRERRGRSSPGAPISIYEVHIGSWRREVATYRELASTLVPYVADLGFTHIELLPVAEHPFDGSWGYQTLGLFAPSSRFGGPDDLRAFVDAAHAAGLGVIIDWVPGHFPTDVHGLAHFDGTALYEHADPRQGFHPDWHTAIYNLGRREISNFLIANALFWCHQFHIDGLRVDAVASMLYLDYSRRPGEWIPNEFGGRENLAAVAFLRRLNETLAEQFPGVATFAEESTAWPGVTAPTSAGGLGFTYKWNMGWMHDTLQYFEREPIHRRFHQDELTFGLVYAWDERFVLPLSHDEVVHGKGSLLEKMPGDRWQKFANMRLLYGMMFAHPGKKLLFMGAELAQFREWNHDASLDWNLLEFDEHRGIFALVRDLNALYSSHPALHARDTRADGFEWIDYHDTQSSVLAFIRHGDRGEQAIFACNATPMPRERYRIGVPRPGRYAEFLNTDSAYYGGSNLGNSGGVQAENIPLHGREWSLELSLPPLAMIALEAP